MPADSRAAHCGDRRIRAGIVEDKCGGVRGDSGVDKIVLAIGVVIVRIDASPIA